MRNLAPGLFGNFEKLIRETAIEIHTCDNCGDIDKSKQIALTKLQPFRQELGHYPTFRLEKVDMLVVSGVITKILCDIDPSYKDGIVDTQHGNASIIVQTGVVIAALVSNFKMLQSVRHHNQAVAEILEQIHDIFLVDPGDSRIFQISEDFIANNAIDAAMTPGLLKSLTEIYIKEIRSIDEQHNYLAKHMFSTGFNQYPGIGGQIEMLLA